MRQSDSVLRPGVRGWRGGLAWAIAATVWIGLAACGGGGGGGGDGDGDGGGVAPPPPAASGASSPAATIAGPDGATLKLPEGALAMPAPTLRIAKDASAAPPLPAVFAPAGDVFAVTPDATPLQARATLRIPVAAATPAGTQVAIAEANADGSWTLRTDARIDGDLLEIEVSRLGHFQVVRPAEQAVVARGPRALATAPRLVRWAQGIRISAPGFADGQLSTIGGPVPVVERLVPFIGLTTVGFQAEAYSSRPGFCDRPASIGIDQFAFQGAGAVPLGSAYSGTFTTTPWTFDLPTLRPGGSTTTVFATVTVYCRDASGALFGVRADRAIHYEFDTSSLEFAMSAPDFSSVNNIPGFRQALVGAAPFGYARTVPLTLQLLSSTGLDAQCAEVRSVDVRYVDPGNPVADVALLTESFPVASRAGPWTVDLQVFNLSPSTGTGVARLTLVCLTAESRSLSVSVDRVVLWQVSESGVGFLGEPADAAGAVGQSVTFQVRVAGGPPSPSDRDQYRLIWEQSRDEAATWRPLAVSYQLDIEPRLSLPIRNHPLTLGPLSAADNGSRVRARACYAPPGQIERCVQGRSARVSVAQAAVGPAITRQPRGASTLVGETASFDLAFTGTPSPAVQWQVQQGVAAGWTDVAPGGNAATLVTPPATPQNDGWLYRAVIANAAGTVVSDAVVWRVSPTPLAPSITVQPRDAAAPTGGRAVFAIAADGTGPLSFRWLKDGTPIVGANQPVLALDHVQASDVAGYRAVVSGPGGSATSDAATLSLLAGPAVPAAPTIVAQPVAQTVPLGQAATFTVGVGGGPPVACQWLRNGVAIAGAVSCTGYATPATQAADNGAVFNVVAYNAGGTVVGGGALLTVQVPAGPTDRWTVLPSNASLVLYDVAVVGPRNVVVAVGYDGRIHRSTDGGDHWSVAHDPADPAKSLGKVRFVDGQVGIAVGRLTIARSTDGGATWREVLDEATAAALAGGVGQEWRAVDWLDANTAVVVGLHRVWISRDRGATWQPHGNADFASLGLGNVNAVRFADATVGFAAESGRLLRTADGGLTWGDVAPPYTVFTDPIYGIEHGLANEWVAVGGSGLYRSVDGGLNWTRTPLAGVLGSAGYLSALKARGRELVAAGENGIVLSSLDFGVSWTVQPPLGFGQLFGVDFVEANGSRPIVVVGAGGVIARLD